MLDGAEAGFASKGSPLHEAANLFLTPRLGSHTRESRLRASWYVAHRLHETLSSSRTSTLDQPPSAPMGLHAAGDRHDSGGGPGDDPAEGDGFTPTGSGRQFIVR
jgi:D-3-phosphoglycerate dehydrogenase